MKSKKEKPKPTTERLNMNLSFLLPLFVGKTWEEIVADIDKEFELAKQDLIKVLPTYLPGCIKPSKKKLN